MSDLEVIRVDDEQRYVVNVDGEPAGYAQYELRAGRVVFTHTEVDDDFEGEGVGSTLVRHALDDVRDGGQDVRVECEFMRSWIERHPDYADLLDSPVR